MGCVLVADYCNECGKELTTIEERDLGVCDNCLSITQAQEAFNSEECKKDNFPFY